MTLTTASTLFWVNWIVYALTSVVLGNAVDKRGLGPSTRLFGAITLGLGLVLTATADSAWEAVIWFGLVAGFGSALIGNVPANFSTAKQFPEHSGTALGIVNSGVGVGTTVFPLLVAAVLSLSSWRASWVAVALVSTLPILLLAGKLPPPQPTKAGPHQATLRVGHLFRLPDYWILFAAFLFALFAQYSAIVHLPNAGISKGFSASTASLALALVGGASILGRLVFGAAADRFRNPATVSIPGAIAFVVGISVTAVATDSGLYLAGASLLGLGIAVYGPMWGNVIAHRFSGPMLGRAYGTLLLGAGIGGAIGPVVISAIVESGGTYMTAFAVASASSVLAVPLFFLKGGTVRASH